MSHYWNNHPEDYDELMRRGMARYMADNGDRRDIETIMEWLEERPMPIEAERRLEREAHDYIVAEEQYYWGDMADAAMGRAEAMRDL